MKIYYYLSKSKKRRVQLESKDIHALLFLNEQSILSQPQFHEFYSLLKHISEAAFRRKMSRWNNANIINKRKVKMKNGYEMGIIELTNAGQSILKKLGYLKENEKLKYHATSNLDHTLAIKQCVIEFLKNVSHIDPFYIADGGKYIIPFGEEDKNDELEQPIIIFKKQNFGNDFIPPLKSLAKYSPDFIEKYKKSGVVQSFVPQDFIHIKEQLGDKTGLTPDWIFKVKDTFIYVEVDSGSEKIKTKRDHANTIIEKHDVKSIEGKLYRYQELAKNDTEHKHKVIFTLMDDSDGFITTNIHSNKDTRIANLKHEIAHMDDYKDWGIDVYVTGMKRFFPITEGIYLELFDDEESDITNKYRDTFIALIKAGLKPNWRNTKYALVHDYKAHNISVNGLNYIPHFVYKFHQEEGNKYEQYFIPVFIRAGNVKDMEILAYYTVPIERRVFKYNAKILAIYETEEQLFNDVLRKTRKVTSNKISKEKVDNNGMDTDNIVFVALDEISEGELRMYNFYKKVIDKSQIFL
ncbi:hypothetical protein [Bacillus sp. V5-8f]|uniref:hypothetical protein n=1 Tax=Bacillus sp. V5-8f TaxID=2053044 RepID=UPI000C78FFBB|nr:hypothetical protein [Bacillus sp. V5-8f]PLT33647.1 hypothetical protein CUU64_10985 [Bacillus sp. V5-8f]